MSLLRTPPDRAVVTHPDTRPHSPVPARIFTSDRRVFIAATGIIYGAAIMSATLTLHPYFSQTWDVITFIHAGQRLFAGDNPFDLYAASRAADNWPYAYPPLHALVVALALRLGDLLRVLPGYVWARLPALLADLGVGAALYAIVQRRSGDIRLGRAALALWLFNPVTFYDTAVQGHFESEWLLFVLLAYTWSERARGLIAASIALATAVLFKQIAIVFVLPVWVTLAVGAKPLRDLIKSILPFALVAGGICLPFLLYSNDFLYMNLTYLENVPVQTQSWLVAVLGLTRGGESALTSDFFLLRYQTLVTMLAALVIACVAARRGWSLYLTGALIAVAFFLTSKKVMGYYYVMLFPFLLAELLPRRRFDLILAAVLATTWISLSPYYADWTDHAHWWIYALLGTLNSVFFVWLFAAMVPRAPAEGRKALTETRSPAAAANLPLAVVVTGGLVAAALFAALLQPLIASGNSPIRAPVVTPGIEPTALVTFVALVALAAIALAVMTRATGGAVRLRAWGAVLTLTPLLFAVYTLTKESTAIFEFALKAFGG